jgi:hypothetical protein
VKLLPGNETVLAIPAFLNAAGVPQLVHATNGSVAPIDAPTKAILDSYITKTAPSAANPTLGGNLSGAIRDDLALGLTGSERSTSRTITSVGRNEALTFFNFQANLTVFLDADRALSSASVFNLARISTRVQGLPYVLAHRLGRRNTDAAVVGEDWSYFYAETGQPVPGYGDGDEQTIALNFVPKNIVNIAAALGA